MHKYGRTLTQGQRGPGYLHLFIHLILVTSEKNLKMRNETFRFNAMRQFVIKIDLIEVVYG